MDARQQATQRLRDKGLPVTPVYLMAEMGGARPEPEEVVARPERGATGKFEGRKAGAIATALAPKKVYSEEQGAEVMKPTLKGSTPQLDLIDGRNLGSTRAVYAMVSVDVATRKIYGELMRGKAQTVLLMLLTALDVPSMLTKKLAGRMCVS